MRVKRLLATTHSGFLTGFCFVAGLVMQGSAPNATSGGGGGSRWVLLYAGGPTAPSGVPRYSVADLVHYVAAVDTLGHPVAWLTTGGICLQLTSASHRLFLPFQPGIPATGEDWEGYVDSIVLPGGVLHRLDSAVTMVREIVGPAPRRYRVAVMIPYPDPKVDSLRFRGTTYRLESLQGRARLTQAYISATLARLTARTFPSLKFAGFYWLKEDIPPADSALLVQVARQVHAAGLAFFWIPAFSPRSTLWSQWGFDTAWLQPNYFFRPDVPSSRLDTAFAIARRAGLGIEVEFNREMFTSQRLADRLLPYLSYLSADTSFRWRSVAIYEGAGALVRLAESRDPWWRAVYRRFVWIIGDP